MSDASGSTGIIHFKVAQVYVNKSLVTYTCTLKLNALRTAKFICFHYFTKETLKHSHKAV